MRHPGRSLTDIYGSNVSSHIAFQITPTPQPCCQKPFRVSAALVCSHLGHFRYYSLLFPAPDGRALTSKLPTSGSPSPLAISSALRCLKPCGHYSPRSIHHENGTDTDCKRVLARCWNSFHMGLCLGIFAIASFHATVEMHPAVAIGVDTVERSWLAKWAPRDKPFTWT